MKSLLLLFGWTLWLPTCVYSQTSQVKYLDSNDQIKVLIVKDPYSDSRTGPEKLKGPENLDNQELAGILSQNKCHIVESILIKMPEEWNTQYGEWNRASLTNNVLNKTIAKYNKDELFVLGLLSGNKSLIGMLAGLQHMGPDRMPLQDARGKDILGLPRLGKSKPLKVGLIWISSSAAFNTPEITLEGDMGGMNLAVAAGLSNTDLRLQAGLDPAISTRHITMIGAWDTNAYEEHQIDNSFISRIPVSQIMAWPDLVNEQVKLLSSMVDIIYVHLDLSILGPGKSDDPNHEALYLPANNLKETIENIFSFPKAAALGIASCPDSPEPELLKDANLLIAAALKGIHNR